MNRRDFGVSVAAATTAALAPSVPMAKDLPGEYTLSFFTKDPFNLIGTWNVEPYGGGGWHRVWRTVELSNDELDGLADMSFPAGSWGCCARKTLSRSAGPARSTRRPPES